MTIQSKSFPNDGYAAIVFKESKKVVNVLKVKSNTKFGNIGSIDVVFANTEAELEALLAEKGYQR